MNNSVYTYSDHFILADGDLMRPDCDSWEKYGMIRIPEQAKRLFDGHSPGYRIKAEHPSPSFWGNSQDSETVLKKFTEQLFAGLVGWSDPNHVCKHCGRFYDPQHMSLLKMKQFLIFLKENGVMEYGQTIVQSVSVTCMTFVLMLLRHFIIETK